MHGSTAPSFSVPLAWSLETGGGRRSSEQDVLMQESSSNNNNNNKDFIYLPLARRLGALRTNSRKAEVKGNVKIKKKRNYCKAEKSF